MNPNKTVPVVLVREADDASWYIELIRSDEDGPRAIMISNGMSSKTTADARAAEIRGGLADAYHAGTERWKEDA